MSNKDHTDRDTSKRLQILSSAERSIYYDLPELSLNEREHFFDLCDEELIYLSNMKSINSKVLFVLQLGYFKAKKRFFTFSSLEPSVKEDIEYIIKRYFPSVKRKSIKIDKNIRLKQRNIILKLFSYKLSSECEKEIIKKCKDTVAIDINPKYLFKEVFRFVQYHRIILPSYSTMQKIVSKTILELEKIYTHIF